MGIARVLTVGSVKCTDTMPHVLCRLPALYPVSVECRDLLRHIFVPDPAERISIKSIQKHPWCTLNLPAIMRDRDYNSQFIQHVDAKERAEQIKQTVHAAVQAGRNK